MREATVLFGVGDAGLQDEVLDFLDRRPGIRIVGAASDAAELGRAAAERRPDVVVSDGIVAASAPRLDASLLLVERRESTESLRAALRAGARGFYLWPEERDALARDAEAARRQRDVVSARGSVVAVYAARGGAGATFLATNLAAALAAADQRVALIDADVTYADVFASLAEPEGEASLRELAAVVDELTYEHLERVVRRHPSGFDIVAAPPVPDPLDARVVTSVIDVARGAFDATVLHLPRTLDAWVRAAVAEADVVLIVTTLDVPAVRTARRALDHLDNGAVRGRCRLVVNRAARGELVAGDVSDALGLPVAEVIPFDRNVERSQNRGELVVGRSTPAARRVTRLAKGLGGAAA